MTLLRRLAVLGFLLIAAMPRGWAQSGFVPLENGQALTTYGFTFTISGCNWATNVSSGTSGACASGVGGTGGNLDGLVLKAVQTGRDTVSVQVANSTASSAALTQALGGNKSYLAFTITVSEATGSTKFSGALLTAVGLDNTSGGTTTFTTQATSGSFSSSPLNPASAWGSSPSTQTKSSNPDNLTSLLSGFSFAENIQLKSTTSTGSALALNTLTMKFYTTPEPASISALLVGLTGLVMVRRRRRAS
jgi:hypothetical protein